MALMQIPRKLTTASRDAFSVSQPKSIQSFDSVSLERKICGISRHRCFQRILPFWFPNGI